MKIQGLHHITLITADARRNVDFYTRVLGQRLVKRTVNFDDPGTYHLYFGNETGSAGTAITFFEWPHAKKGAHGIGGTHHFALSVHDYDGLLKWKRRLTDLNIRVRGPYERSYFSSIYFEDPDGVVVEIATAGPGFTIDEPESALGTTELLPPAEYMSSGRSEADITGITWPDPVPEITADMALLSGLHHISAISSDIERTHGFFGELLGMQLVKRTFNYEDLSSKHWYWGVDNGRVGTLVTYFERSPKNTRIARQGAGHTHHFALAVKDDEQEAWREHLLSAGLTVSPIRDRTYFKSIYTRDPDGHIIELATLGPGFTVDEPIETLGQALMLPPQVELQRDQLEIALAPLTVPVWSRPK